MFWFCMFLIQVPFYLFHICCRLCVPVLLYIFHSVCSGSMCPVLYVPVYIKIYLHSFRTSLAFSAVASIVPGVHPKYVYMLHQMKTSVSLMRITRTETVTGSGLMLSVLWRLCWLWLQWAIRSSRCSHVVSSSVNCWGRWCRCHDLLMCFLSVFFRESQRISAQNRTVHCDWRNHLAGARLLWEACECWWYGE